MDELSKVGDINSVGDFFDFKLSIKSIIIIGIIWSILAGLFIIFILIYSIIIRLICFYCLF